MKINIKNINIKSICATLFISLFLACNNGIEELEKRNTFLSSLANLGNDFLNVFTSFGESFGGVLGFNTNTQKSEIGTYFNTVKETVEGIKSKLNAIIENMKREGNPNASGTEAAVADLNKKLDQIIEGASDAIKGVGDSESIGNIADAGSAGAKAEDTSVKSLIEGIGKIVGIVLGTNEGNPDAGDDKKAEDGNASRTDSTGVAKLFVSGSNGAGSDVNAKKVATDAAKAVGAATGADILKAISQGNDGKAAQLATNSASTAAAANNAKDATIAGAIALRAMAKDGKFANGNFGNDISTAVKKVALSAVTKALNTLTIAIRKTIDEGLKEVKKAMKINLNDNPVATEVGTVVK
ncbi:variable large family protein (plasmid) [Borrelia coriaceae]|uniref:Variable large protein n=1 Tax=Borrelia coriaceae ATCC 43381 TaxID=1408429 RepID=W5SXM0_9SPIR|nr:variable large family protein [Borrelia coriaceae]AHH11433.1 Variable outer membrane protein [Borrelia coriaceae ATCC 43381]UPA17411.1 variable large family protein [Borrelia coriaceae]